MRNRVALFLLFIVATGMYATDGEDMKYANWRSNMGLNTENTIDGEVEIINEFDMPELGRTRTLRIFLPEGYRDSDKRYPVIYMHDGQNLFDDHTSFAGEWKIDETINAFIRDLKWVGAIVVGIDNGGDLRLNEYSPWFNSDRNGGGEGDRYVDFLVKTLKPWIDNRYRTLTDRDNTMVAGSSLGGLISLYAGMKYPETFSRLGLFSPAFWFAKQQLIDMIGAVQISQNFRIYLDAGTLEGTAYVGDAKQFRMILENKGVKHLKLVIDEGARHNEAAWARRFPDALRWLMEF